MIVKKIKNKVFRVELTVVISTQKEFKKYIIKNFGKKAYRGINNPNLIIEGLFVYIGDVDLIWIRLRKPKLMIGTIVHEVSHFVYDLCSYKGINDTETFSYLNEYYFNEILKELNAKIKLARIWTPISTYIFFRNRGVGEIVT